MSDLPYAKIRLNDNSYLTRENSTREEESPQIQETIEQKIDTIIKMLERIAIALETK